MDPNGDIRLRPNSSSPPSTTDEHGNNNHHHQHQRNQSITLSLQFGFGQFLLSLGKKFAFKRFDKITTSNIFQTSDKKVHMKLSQESDTETTYTLPDNQMATNLVKWMKTKLNGYKQFTVMPNDLTDGRLSDTEVLLKPSNFLSQETNVPFAAQRSQQNRFYTNGGSDSQPILQPSSIPSAHVSFHHENSKLNIKRQLNLEELECDVSVEGCAADDKGNGQRQEFSFTLYDLDGHGKITKDDIAGLVKTIYETLGQSIKVPHYGSKTIKVKLTVSPEKKNKTKSSTEEVCSSPFVAADNQPEKSHQQQQQHTSSGSNKDKDCNRWRKDVIIGGGNCRYHREKRYRQHHQQQQHDHRIRRRHSISSSGGGVGVAAGEACSEDREADVSENEQEDDQPSLNRRLQNPAFITNVSPIYSRYKKRSSSLQRQELLQIIQANMEKNNLCFHTLRKPNATSCTVANNNNNELRDLSQHHHFRSSGKLKQPTTAPHRTNNSNDCSPIAATGGCRPTVNFNNISAANKCVKPFPASCTSATTFYVQHKNTDNNANLVTAGVDNNRHTATAANRRVDSSRNDYQNNQHRRAHHRSRSYDLPNCRYSFSEDKQYNSSNNNNNINNNLNKTIPIARREFPTKIDQNDKTATRDQVVRWLEQEFYSPEVGKHNHFHRRNRKENKTQSSPLAAATSVGAAADEGQKNITNGCNNTNHNNNSNNNTNNNNNINNRRACSLHHHHRNQDRREHHHVHEHVHHHYHHYRDSMPIVV